MARKKKEIILDLDNSIIPTVRVNKLDDIDLYITIKNIDDLENTNIQLFILKPNGMLVEQEDSTIYFKNRIVFNIKNGAFDAVGSGTGQLRIISDDGKISTSKFTIVVSDTIANDNFLVNAVGIEAFEKVKQDIEQLKQQGVTDEQISNAVNEYLENNPVSGGMSEADKNKLDSLTNYDDTEVKTDIQELKTNSATKQFVNDSIASAITSSGGLTSEQQSKLNLLDDVDGLILGSLITTGTSTVESANKFDKTQVVNNKILIENGAESAVDNYSYGTQYITIDPTKKYAFTGCYGKNQQLILYKEDKSYLKTVYTNQCTGTAGKSLVCDFSTLSAATAKYARINTTTGKLAQYMFVQSDTYPNEYIPYSPAGTSTGSKEFKSNDIKEAVKAVGVNGVNVGKVKPVGEVYGPYPGQSICIGDSTPSDDNFDVVAIGYKALSKLTLGDGTNTQAGKFNVAVGSGAGELNTTGNHNTFAGFQAGHGNTTGEGNTFIGEDAGILNSTANGNTSIGRYSLKNNKVCAGNTAVGLNALLNTGGDNSNTSTSYDTAINNTGVGVSAGTSNKQGHDNSYFGYFANGADGLQNATAIGASAYVKTSNTIQLGNSSVTKVASAGEYECTTKGKGLILYSANGTKYRVSVSDAGTLTVASIS